MASVTQRTDRDDRATIKRHCRSIAESLFKEVRKAAADLPLDDQRSMTLEMLEENIPQIQESHRSSAVGDYSEFQYRAAFIELVQEISRTV